MAGGVIASFRDPLATNVFQSLPYWLDVRKLKRWNTISEAVTVVDRCIGPASQRIPASYTNVSLPRLLGQAGRSQVLEKDVQLIPMFEGQRVDDLSSIEVGAQNVHLVDFPFGIVLLTESNEAGR